MKKKVSQKDIAQLAGVSTALVSYVLSGKEKEYRVGSDITQKIKSIAEEFGYQPNLLAKSLRSGRTQTIGLIIADIANPFFANLAREIENEAEASGYSVIIGSSDETTDRAWKLTTLFLNKQVDGFIIVPTENTEPLIEHLMALAKPFVLLDRHFPHIATNFVVTDNFNASYVATSHLIEQGYHRIGLIAYTSAMFHMQERIRGYQQALQESGLNPRSTWLKQIEFTRTAQDISLVIDELTHPGNAVDALVFATYGLAVNGLKYINKKRLNVPDELGIVSFGQAEGFDLYRCPITYIRQALEDLGRLSVQTLINQITNPDDPLIQRTLPAQLIVRESSKSQILTQG